MHTYYFAGGSNDSYFARTEVRWPDGIETRLSGANLFASIHIASLWRRSKSPAERFEELSDLICMALGFTPVSPLRSFDPPTVLDRAEYRPNDSKLFIEFDRRPLLLSPEVYGQVEKAGERGERICMVDGHYSVIRELRNGGFSANLISAEPAYVQDGILREHGFRVWTKDNNLNGRNGYGLIIEVGEFEPIRIPSQWTKLKKSRRTGMSQYSPSQ